MKTLNDIIINLSIEIAAENWICTFFSDWPNNVHMLNCNVKYIKLQASNYFFLVAGEVRRWVWKSEKWFNKSLQICCQAHPVSLYWWLFLDSLLIAFILFFWECKAVFLKTALQARPQKKHILITFLFPNFQILLIFWTYSQSNCMKKMGF